MSTDLLNSYISKIREPDVEAIEKARWRLDSLVKPPGSLGRLEDIAAALAGISGEMIFDPSKRCVIIMSSDNGVVEENVASAPQEVTHMMTLGFIKGITGAAVLAKQFGADLIVVDIGVNADIDHPLIKNKKIRKSTWNIAKRNAMTRGEAERAILTGIETAVEAVNNGYTLLGAGEMGIGNTTTSSAVLCALTGIPAEQAAGKGAGLKEEAYRHKISVIRTALEINKPDSSDAIDVLAKVGGFDIAAMAGLYIGGAYMRVPVVIDGFISMVAALAASRICPASKNYMFASHVSFEQGFAHAARSLGVEPCMTLNMRLGEGSGCPLMFAVIDAACAVIRDMGTFEQASIGDEYLNEIKDGDNFSVST
ncbi:MAG: nicotinate-nucleotide--dimethylbenzimidazole phosphoribosyltransferase [Oscillospiraceae bacterium]|nr:nicotinate-nucleotide--dimethylbenzimidazole phosphoribosyltransferase [Oscillospiraceae bacterium]